MRMAHQPVRVSVRFLRPALDSLRHAEPGANALLKNRNPKRKRGIGGITAAEFGLADASGYENRTFFNRLLTP